MQNEPLYWKSAMRLGILKNCIIFTIIYRDLKMTSSSKCPYIPSFDLETFNFDMITVIGFLLFSIGQLLNIAVFSILGRVGAYFGNEFGYKLQKYPNFHTNHSINILSTSVLLEVYGDFIFWCNRIGTSFLGQ